MTRLLLIKKSLQASRKAVPVADPVVGGLRPNNAIRLLSSTTDNCHSCTNTTTTSFVGVSPRHGENLWMKNVPNHYNHLLGSGRPRCRRDFSSAATTIDSDSDGEDGVIPFLLADIGEGIKEVELLQWFVQEGDHVQQFDRICEVQSDKATVEITSRYDGVVVSLAGGSVGDMVQVGSPLLQIRVEGGAAATAMDHGDDDNTAATADASTSQAPSEVLHNQDSSDNQLHIPHVASQFHLDSDDDKEDGFGTSITTTGSSSSSSSSSSTLGKFLATPAVRKLGMEYNLDLSTLVGTGPQGRVLKKDVLTFLRENGKMSSPSSSSSFPSSSTQPAVPSTSGAAAATAPMPAARTASTYLEEDEILTLKGYNRLMIQTMTASREIPHMGFTDEFNVTKLTDFRKEMSPKVSILAFFLKATSLALKEYPIINASWKDIDNAQVTLWANHNIGVAMDTPRGLVVPVIRNCQNKSLVDIQNDLDALKEIAAAGKLGEEHLTGATFTLSNIGSVGGGTYMNPLIVPPQGAIGAMGSMQTLPRFDSEGAVMAAKIINVSWAGDHRMIDGATLARFSNLTKDYLQDPVRMLVAMK